MSEALIMPPAGEVAVKRAPTVYFIDDSATMREVIKIAFRRENINVITCADAASALAQFEQNRPDVVITDVIMPNQDGYAVCSQIKQHPEFGGIPVVLMSGVVNKSVADKAVAVQADELIRKPFQPQELIGRVRTLLAPKEPAASQSDARTRQFERSSEFVCASAPGGCPRPARPRNSLASEKRAVSRRGRAHLRRPLRRCCRPFRPMALSKAKIKRQLNPSVHNSRTRHSHQFRKQISNLPLRHHRESWSCSAQKSRGWSC